MDNFWADFSPKSSDARSRSLSSLRAPSPLQRSPPVDRARSVRDELTAYLNIAADARRVLITDQRELARMVDELRDSFPRIHRALKIIACVPATQAECERVFSSAGRILTELRSRLSAEHSADLVFLYRNLHEGSKELAECDAEWFYDQHGYPTGNLVHDDDDDDDSAATPSAKRT